MKEISARRSKPFELRRSSIDEQIPSSKNKERVEEDSHWDMTRKPIKGLKML